MGISVIIYFLSFIQFTPQMGGLEVNTLVGLIESVIKLRMAVARGACWPSVAVGKNGSVVLPSFCPHVSFIPSNPV